MQGRSLFPALTIILLAAVASAQNNNTILGKVRSTSGAAVNNAIVELRIGGGAMIAQTVTRTEGDFAFANLVAGEYEIAVTMAGYEPAVQRARFHDAGRMNSMEVINVEVLIRPRADPAPTPPGTNFVQDVPKAARAAYDRGVSRLREGKPDEGVRLLREAIAQFDTYFDAHFALGVELFRQGKDADAIGQFERCRLINDRQDGIYYMFGLVMLKQQKFGVAEYSFAQAVSLNSNNALSHYYLGQTMIEIALRTADDSQRAQRLDSADKELDRAWELSQKRINGVHLQRARIHERRGDKQSAARELESYLKAEPNAKNAASIREAITKLRGDKK
ncbi:MAG TPA: carboxypeptidase regulatory-like domain-containing protein [Blastocatellia bacterium]|jgi:Tfp pilus assembly protein PilF